MKLTTDHPMIIQGGMGVAVSNWRLAKAVSQCGQLGVVSGTFLDTIIARRLQDGDRDGSIRRALSRFPLPDVARRVLQDFFVDGGKASSTPYKPVGMHCMRSARRLIELTIVANFVEVFLAKENHEGAVGINYLTKIDLPTLPSLYGAMLAGVDYVLMGAGIPKAIPVILDRLSLHQAVSLKIEVQGVAGDDNFEVSFDPAGYSSTHAKALKRPYFFPIVSSSTLAQSLARKASGRVDGFVVEHYSAGGHNAPPRGGLQVDFRGEPIYGPKDEPWVEDFVKLGLPFWWAGSCASPERLQEMVSRGARGIQVGTAFAYCNESGITDSIKKRVIEGVLSGQESVFTDPRASSSGYPFKVVQLVGSLSEEEEYDRRTRICDLGYLRCAYKTEAGNVAFRCPAEPIDDFVRKGGQLEETIGRKCLCNGLLSTVGYPQVRGDEYVEPPLVTAGAELSCLRRFLLPGENSYSAQRVLEHLLGTVLHCSRPVLELC